MTSRRSAGQSSARALATLAAMIAASRCAATTSDTDGSASVGLGGRDTAPAPDAAQHLEQQRIADLRVDEQADGHPEDDGDGGHRSSES